MELEGDILKLIAAIVTATGPVTIDVATLESVSAEALKIQSVGQDKFTISVE